ncbi:hypothetical protein B0H11DRAFT_225349 [Mycena galericulata]|nr:hypothetical protein B0H11DRAFT_225349 [Mycena galericulata]
MASVTRLRSRIEELSSAIDHQSSSVDHQKQLLKDLESQKSAVQSELNSILDPVARLPLEISSRIFMRCLPSPPDLRPSQAPAIFLNICRAWRNLALSTPSLWAAIGDENVPVAQFSKIFQTWLSRAQSVNLSIFLQRSLNRKYTPAAVEALVKRCAHQVQKMHLEVPSGDHLERINAPFTALTSLKVEGTPSTNLFSLNADECVEILRAAPHLVECSFSNIAYEEDIRAIGYIPTPLTHTSLLHLRLGQFPTPFSYGDNTSVILQYLTLPALQDLLISDFDITPADLSSFLTRSSPPLQSLYISVDDEGEVADLCVKLVPSLTELDIGHFDGIALPSLEALASSQAHLPDLRRLTIRGLHVVREYGTVLDLLTSRQASLQSFCLLAESLPDDFFDDADEASDDILGSLRELATGGMHIHIGTIDESIV